VATSAIVITFDITKYRRTHSFPTEKTFFVDVFNFQRVKEAFRAGIIETAISDAHAVAKVMPL